MPKKTTEIMEWLDATLADPELSCAVDERMAEMKVEQEASARRERRRKATRRPMRRVSVTEVRRRFGRVTRSAEPFLVTSHGGIVAVVYPLAKTASLPGEIKRELREYAASQKREKRR